MKRARDGGAAKSGGSIEEDTRRRTLRVLLSLACETSFKCRVLAGGFSVANAHWYQFEGEQDGISKDDAAMIEAAIKAFVKGSMSLRPTEMNYVKAIDYFKSAGQPVAAKQLENRVPLGGKAKVWEIELAGKKYYRLHHFPLLSDTSALSSMAFSVAPYAAGGFILINGTSFIDQPALTKSISRQMVSSSRASVTSTADVCAMADSDSVRGVFIHSCEARLEAQIQECSRQIHDKHRGGGGLKVVCIAGPTASGKTTFAHKLSLSLQSFGITASPLTVDHYYLPLDRQPKFLVRQERSDVDYDSIESMDLELVQEHILKLSCGETCLTPVYNMKTGYRDPPGKEMALAKGGVLIIEGIHALNPEYTSKIDALDKFKIFISPIPSLQLDDFNVVKSTDHRLCRRMSRDYLFRGNSAARTLKMWGNVRRGEEKWIFPHQNHADYVVNSAMEYEVAILKARLEGLLRGVAPENSDADPEECPVFLKAQLLLHVLDQVHAWPDVAVPCASLMREFIGGSAFDVH